MGDDEFTKEQQDAYFHDGRCPYCRSDEIRIGFGWEESLTFQTDYKAASCETCEQEWFEVRYQAGGCRFLVKSLEELGDTEDDNEMDDSGVTEDTFHRE